MLDAAQIRRLEGSKSRGRSFQAASVQKDDETKPRGRRRSLRQALYSASQPALSIRPERFTALFTLLPHPARKKSYHLALSIVANQSGLPRNELFAKAPPRLPRTRCESRFCTRGSGSPHLRTTATGPPPPLGIPPPEPRRRRRMPRRPVRRRLSSPQPTGHQLPYRPRARAVPVRSQYRTPLPNLRHDHQLFAFCAG